MKATASLSVILVAVILALGDGAYLLTDSRGQSHHSLYHGAYHYPQKGELNFWLEIGKFPAKIYLAYSQQAEPGSRWSYIVKWCSLCFLTETEMDAIQRALNQAATPSSKEF